jgi:hypothetical protein
MWGAEVQWNGNRLGKELDKQAGLNCQRTANAGEVTPGVLTECHLLKRFRLKSDIKRCPESRIEQVVSSQKYENKVKNLTRDRNFRPL